LWNGPCTEKPMQTPGFERSAMPKGARMPQSRKTSRRGSSKRQPASKRQASGKRQGSSKKRTAHTSPVKKTPTASNRRWSHHVMETSDALDLEPSVFSRGTARQIALSLKRSAERSRRRKSAPFRSAMSMLTFYINRGGKNLSPTRLRVLNQAKDELRDVFHRT
jgi:hypothetical protein